MIGRTNVSGGGAGATLEVTAPVGCTVTVSKDGKTKTKVADSSGVAVFKGLSSGKWSVTITDGSQTATKTVTITADYDTTMSFFMATINVTYPAGSVCTATDGVTTLTAPDTSGTWDCVVPNTGTWTVTVKDNGWKDTVDIMQNGQEDSVYLDKAYLYREGNEYSTMTGGLTVTNSTAGTIVKGENSIVMDLKGIDGVNGFGAVYTTKKINITGKTKLTVNYNWLESISGSCNAYVGIYSSVPTINNFANPVAYIKNGSSNELSLSDINGDYYIAACSILSGSRNYFVKMNIKEMYLD